MRTAYSQDLRLHILAVFDGGMGKQSVHQTFGVSRSTLDHWLKRRQATGAVKAITNYKRGPAPAMSDSKAFEQFAQHHSDATLGQMAVAWQEQTGQKLSLNTFEVKPQHLFCGLKAPGLDAQKRVFCTRSATRTNDRSLFGS